MCDEACALFTSNFSHPPPSPSAANNTENENAKRFELFFGRAGNEWRKKSYFSFFFVILFSSLLLCCEAEYVSLMKSESNTSGSSFAGNIARAELNTRGRLFSVQFLFSSRLIHSVDIQHSLCEGVCFSVPTLFFTLFISKTLSWTVFFPVKELCTLASCFNECCKL